MLKSIWQVFLAIYDMDRLKNLPVREAFLSTSANHIAGRLLLSRACFLF
jgi:hypothetical protein